MAVRVGLVVERREQVLSGLAILRQLPRLREAAEEQQPAVVQMLAAALAVGHRQLAQMEALLSAATVELEQLLLTP